MSILFDDIRKISSSRAGAKRRVEGRRIFRRSNPQNIPLAARVTSMPGIGYA